METRIIEVEHTDVSPHANVNQHYQQHFQTHYALANGSENNLSSSRFPSVHHIETYQQPLAFTGSRTSFQRHEPVTAYESHQSQMMHSNAIDHLPGKLSITEQKNEQMHNAKKTVQTVQTTTTTTPLLIDSGEPGDTIEVIQPVIHSGYVKNSKVEFQDPNSYSIKVEYHPVTESFNWTNCDTYLHIFLTFYFGHFAAMLFFDGIIRNIINLIILDHTESSPFIYILHIVFSIAMLAFTIWFMTVCWRWWRSKSLQPYNGLAYFDHTQRPARPADRHSTAHKYVFIAACVLIIGFFFYLALGIIDLWYKQQQASSIIKITINDEFNHYSSLKKYSYPSYLTDLIVFIFRLVFWITGIIATLLLSRDILMKCCCPAKRIKIDKEKPTTVYEITT
jgi:hypothetical protein